MSRKNDRRRRPRGAAGDRPVVVVCRGGDCGSRAKHPDADHRALLERVRDGVGDDGDVVVSTCLDACDHSNVVVVVPGAAGRETGGAPHWTARVNDDEVVDEVVDWVRAGGPGVVAPPVLVDLYEFRPNRNSRQHLDEVVPPASSLGTNRT